MKIAIVCGHFLPSMGYIEVHLANAFHKLNHEIKVITTNVIPSYVKNISELFDYFNENYQIGKLRTSDKVVEVIFQI